MYGFYRLATCTPVVRTADPLVNVLHIIHLAKQAADHQAAIALFPELSITSATCGDLLRSEALLTASENALSSVLKDMPCDLIMVVGAPVRLGSQLFNAAVVCQNKAILAIIPKQAQPVRHVDYLQQKNIPFGSDILIQAGEHCRVGIEFGNSLLSPIPPSSTRALQGATLMLALAADTAAVGAQDTHKRLIAAQSERCHLAYAYTSAGVHESTTDAVYSGSQWIAENGRILMEAKPLQRHAVISYADVDLQRIDAIRLSDAAFQNAMVEPPTIVSANRLSEPTDCLRDFPRHPFIPQEAAQRTTCCQEILAIQAAGLARRIEHTHANKLVLGISGGLDSTLALLVCINTLKTLGRPTSDLITVTMPGFGTTDRTYNNAVGLCQALNTTFMEISIKEACLRHFQDIGHDPDNRNVVYENAQARERTQILLDIANQQGGLAIGTGDLSEAAMGWCTFNGDHISMYSVNASVPKTLIPYIIATYADSATPQIQAFLQDIIDTPISPELLPASESGEIKQKTEDIIGPYEIHDFFLYHFFKYGAAPDKLLFMAQQAFKNDIQPEAIQRYLQGFIRRFFGQQFKRNCAPDGPKIGSITFSPRTDWHMPSDASNAPWTL